MGIGISVFLIAVGAVMTFALESNSEGGFNIDTIGIILMVVGAIGLFAAMVIFGPRHSAGRTVVEEREVL